MCTRFQIAGSLCALALSLLVAGCVAEVEPAEPSAENAGEAQEAWFGGFPGWFGPPPVIWTAPGVFWSGPAYSIPYLHDFTGATFSPFEGDPPWL